MIKSELKKLKKLEKWFYKAAAGLGYLGPCSDFTSFQHGFKEIESRAELATCFGAEINDFRIYATKQYRIEDNLFHLLSGDTRFPRRFKTSVEYSVNIKNLDGKKTYEYLKLMHRRENGGETRDVLLSPNDEILDNFLSRSEKYQKDYLAANYMLFENTH